MAAIVCALAFGIVAASNTAAAKKLNVVTSTTDMAALAQEVWGDNVSID